MPFRVTFHHNAIFYWSLNNICPPCPVLGYQHEFMCGRDGNGIFLIRGSRRRVKCGGRQFPNEWFLDPSLLHFHLLLGLFLSFLERTFIVHFKEAPERRVH